MTIAPKVVDIPMNPHDRRIWVCAELRRRGSSLTAIGRRLGVSQQAVSQALMIPSSRLEQAIADELGVAVQSLFPERFGADGRRLPNTRAPQRSTIQNPRNVEGEEAA